MITFLIVFVYVIGSYGFTIGARQCVKPFEDKVTDITFALAVIFAPISAPFLLGFMLAVNMD